MVTTSIKEFAAEAYACFESAVRDDDEPDTTYFVRLKDGSPEWVRDLVHAAHGDDFLPDDYRYKWTMEACEFIADADDPEDAGSDFADLAVNVYTSDRLQWLASNLQRPGYCDEAMREYGSTEVGAFSGIVDLIGLGQYAEAYEVYGLVLRALEDHAA